MKKIRIINLLIFYTLIFTSCNFCQNTVIKEIPNLSSNVKAVQFKRNCGATTGDNVQVSIIKPSRFLNNKKGNIFIIKGSIHDIYWKDVNTLVIYYSCKEEDIFYIKEKYDCFDIKYVKK